MAHDVRPARDILSFDATPHLLRRVTGDRARQTTVRRVQGEHLERAESRKVAECVLFHFSFGYGRRYSRDQIRDNELARPRSQWRNTFFQCVPIPSANTPQLPRNLSPNIKRYTIIFPPREETRRRRRRSLATICGPAARKRTFVW
jgi:hypothetical protein